MQALRTHPIGGRSAGSAHLPLPHLAIAAASCPTLPMLSVMPCVLLPSKQVMGSFRAFNKDSPDQPVTLDARVSGVACCRLLPNGGGSSVLPAATAPQPAARTQPFKCRNPTRVPLRQCRVCSGSGILLSTPPLSHPPLSPPRHPQFEDPQGQLVFERHGSSEGDFHFTSNGEGEYKLCFTAKGEQKGFRLSRVCEGGLLPTRDGGSTSYAPPPRVRDSGGDFGVAFAWLCGRPNWQPSALSGTAGLSVTEVHGSLLF